ncbi:unnamed protein product [Ilex paraguariensis]|uniref:Uncharacterized protein n=1 Tax=Ilex paraguariensis TaxID=185542 RepID=A0ABC8T7M8_9AQUA
MMFWSPVAAATLSSYTSRNKLRKLPSMFWRKNKISLKIEDRRKIKEVVNKSTIKFRKRKSKGGEI